ncbi:ATP-binding cassette domain-containing protein, partial [Candidatus Woesearchaeota archaeon]|nr:ATP-binding cassette domain-containing protein [Candidatus Woesearchaeota archaeon]
NMQHFGRLYGAEKGALRDRIPDLLRLVELYDAKDTLAGSISGGMKRRLGIAIAMLHDPQLLIFDEPTAGLDPILRKKMWRLVQKINKKGKTILISSHALSEIEHLCTRIGIIKGGTILTVNTPGKLRDLYSKNEEIHLESFPGRYDIIKRDLIAAKLPISYMNNVEHKLIIYTAKAETVVHNLMHILEKNNETLLSIDVNKPTLDEVFEALTKQPLPVGEKMKQCMDYVESARRQGISVREIKKALARQGWPKNIIKELTG